MNDHALAVPHDERMRETYARMSGQIAQAFAYLPEADAAAAVAKHINRFWSRSMRRDLGLMFNRQPPELHLLVRRAWDAIHFPAA
jgi:formate dehydrogenase subunit delta